MTKEYRQKYYQENREKILAYLKLWREQNQTPESRREYYLANREKLHLRAKEYYQKNKEKLKAYNLKRYYEKKTNQKELSGNC